MIILEDNISAVVDNATDLIAALEGDNGITTVYLDQDIQLVSGGIKIFAPKGDVTVDGTYNGVRHTITEYESYLPAHCITVSAGSYTNTVTFKNMDIVGNNYYGIFYCPESAIYADVTFVIENVSYNGPQMNFHPNGGLRIIDSDVYIAAPASGASVANELAEINRIEIGGVCTLTHTVAGYSMFYIRGASATAAFTVLPGADVRITETNDVFFSSIHFPFAIGAGASVTVLQCNGMFRSTTHRVSSAVIGTDAVFRVYHTAADKPTFHCGGPFTVNRGAEVYMQKSGFSSTTANIWFAGTPSLVLDEPKSFVLYNANNYNFNFTVSTSFTIKAGQMNQWTAAADISTAGNIDDTPLYAWRQEEDDLLVELEGTTTNTATTVTATNLEGELLEQLSSLKFRNGRQTSFGALPFQADVITNDRYPLTGSTAPNGNVKASYVQNGVSYEVTGRADGTGSYSLETESAIETGTVVTLLCNVPFLYGRIQREAVEAGELTMTVPAGTMNFETGKPVDITKKLYGRELDGWTITVTDSRARTTAWKLYAAIEQHLVSTADPAHILTDSMVYVDAENIVTKLEKTPLLVWTGEENQGETLVTEVRWDGSRGFLLQFNQVPVYMGEVYQSQIKWSLEA